MNEDHDDANTTAFAGHYLAATHELMESLATPSGEGFAYAHAEATRANDAAMPGIEHQLAQSLAGNIYDAAKAHGFTLNVR